MLSVMWMEAISLSENSRGLQFSSLVDLPIKLSKLSPCTEGH